MRRMEKLTWRTEEIVAYLEEMIVHGENSNEESELYDEYYWTGKLSKDQRLRRLIDKMNDAWNK